MSDSYFIFLNKPVGPTSQQALTQYKKTLPRGTKVGHHGTLDPFASGLLLVAVGEACKFISYVNDLQKTYVATLKLGQKTDSGDHTGVVTEVQPAPMFSSDEMVTETKILSIFREFLGVTEQIPPMHSAIKVGGKKLYELARLGQVIERKPRQIEIFDLKFLDFAPSPRAAESPLLQRGGGGSSLRFEVTCSRGTYIRTLAEDIAQRLGTVGHLTALARTKLCDFSISCLEGEGDGAQATSAKIAIPELLRHHPKLEVSTQQKIEIYHGKVVKLTSPVAEGVVSLFCENEFLGMGEVSGLELTSKRLMTL